MSSPNNTTTNKLSSKNRKGTKQSKFGPASSTSLTQDSFPESSAQIQRVRDAMRNLEVSREPPTSASQDNELIPPGQVDRSVDPPPSPDCDILPVSSLFVEELVQEIEEKYISLAILEDKHSKWEGYLSDQRVPKELSIRRNLPNLAPHTVFSVVARTELETMYKVHDLAFMRRLRDDLQTKVIPRFWWS